MLGGEQSRHSNHRQPNTVPGVGLVTHIKTAQSDESHHLLIKTSLLSYDESFFAWLSFASVRVFGNDLDFEV